MIILEKSVENERARIKLVHNTLLNCSLIENFIIIINNNSSSYKYT